MVKLASCLEHTPLCPPNGGEAKLTKSGALRIKADQERSKRVRGAGSFGLFKSKCKSS